MSELLSDARTLERFLAVHPICALYFSAPGCAVCGWNDPIRCSTVAVDDPVPTIRGYGGRGGTGLPPSALAPISFKVQASEDIEQGEKVLALFLDPSIDEQTPFAAVRDQAHALLAPERLQQLCRQFAGDGSLDKATFEWKEVDGIMAKVKRNRLLKRENGGGSGGLKFKMVVIRLRTRRLIV